MRRLFMCLLILPFFLVVKNGSFPCVFIDLHAVLVLDMNVNFKTKVTIVTKEK